MPYKTAKSLIPYNLTKILKFYRGRRGTGKTARKPPPRSGLKIAENVSIFPDG